MKELWKNKNFKEKSKEKGIKRTFKNQGKTEPEKDFYFIKWGYTRKDFQKWGRKGELVFKCSSSAERQKVYRRRKA